MPTEYKDGDILVGGFEITLDTSGLTLVVENCQPNLPSKIIQRTDLDDLPAAQLAYQDFATAQLTVAINATALERDYRFDTFTTPHIDGTSAKWFVASQSGAKAKATVITYELTVNRCVAS